MFAETVARHGAVRAQLDPHSKPEFQRTYSELADDVEALAQGLQALGIKHGDRVALLSDNRPRWIACDLALLSFGAVNVPRGSETATQEIWYILNHSESVAAIIQSRKLYQRVVDAITPDATVKAIIMMDDTAGELTAPPGIQLQNYADVMESGRERIRASTAAPKVDVKPDDLASIVYTSGTTGVPKGVMLTHANLTHQADNVDVGIPINAGDLQIAILPAWHVYERAAEYFGIRYGTTLIYTDKRYMRDDLQKYKPHILPCVPRMWESIYDAIHDKMRKETPGKQKFVASLIAASHRYVRARRKLNGTEPRRQPLSAGERVAALFAMAASAPLHFLGDSLAYSKIRSVTGGNLRAAVSGGGSLAPYLDDFFEVVGVPILNGYGLTETSPVLTVRRVTKNVRGSVGQPINHVELLIRDEKRNPVQPGETGIIWARGDGLMKGYYKNAEQTKAVLDDDGWFNTGDLGWITSDGDLVITGRAKDTIVLSSGENVEPEPIESAALKSPLISQIIVVGQDQKQLGAMVVPNVALVAEKLGLPANTAAEKVINNPAAAKLIKDAIAQGMGSHFKPYEQIAKVLLLEEPFSEANGMLTQTLKLKRNVIFKNYADAIEQLFSK